MRCAPKIQLDRHEPIPQTSRDFPKILYRNPLVHGEAFGIRFFQFSMRDRRASGKRLRLESSQVDRCPPACEPSVQLFPTPKASRENGRLDNPESWYDMVFPPLRLESGSSKGKNTPVVRDHPNFVWLPVHNLTPQALPSGKSPNMLHCPGLQMSSFLCRNQFPSRKCCAAYCSNTFMCQRSMISSIDTPPADIPRKPSQHLTHYGRPSAGGINAKFGSDKQPYVVKAAIVTSRREETSPGFRSFANVCLRTPNRHEYFPSS